MLRKKGLYFIKTALAIIYTAMLAIGAAASDGNWGLGFGQEEQPPRGNESSEFLRNYDAVFLGDTSQKVIYLTFDAGYENGYTASILDTLQKHDVKAAFFIVGHYIESSPELVKRMCDEGHVVGNHSYHHPDMTKIGIDEFQKELQSLETLYKTTTGQNMTHFYRPPRGQYCVSNLEQAMKLGYQTVFWSLAYADWMQDKQPTKQQAFDKLLPRIHSGAIVLLHSTSKTNAEILDELITKWKEAGYRFGTLDEIKIQ